jgi:iron complex transport system ATP-binding protein
MEQLKRVMMNCVNDNIVELSQLSTGFPGSVVLAPVTATALKGELVSVIGFNGIGKSTLLRTIAGIQKKISGGFSIDGKSSENMTLKDFAYKVGYVSTEPVTSGNMRVFDLVALGRYNYTNWLGNLTECDREVVLRSIERVGLKGFANRNIDEISDGERQRAMIARVLAQDTPLMIMDEPTAFLDIKNRNEIIHLMHSLTNLEGKTVIMSTHDLSAAISESDNIWLMSRDGIVQGAPEDLVLNGTFEEYFGGSSLKFSPSDGTFHTVRKVRGSFSVEGDDTGKEWVKRALRRIGLNTEEDDGATNTIMVTRQDGEIRAGTQKQGRCCKVHYRL